MVDPTPDALADRYDAPIRHGADVELERAAFERAKDRSDRWGVGAFVTDGRRVLFVRQRGQWLLPGGIAADGESLPAAAIREVDEETGVRVRIDGLAAISEQTFHHAGESIPFRFATFLASPTTDELAANPGLDGEGIDDVAWLDTVPPDAFDRELVERLFRTYV